MAPSIARLIALSLPLILIGASPDRAAAQDVAAGEDVFKKCRACHDVGEGAKNKVGPVLNGLFGRTSGTIEGFNYSDANKAAKLVWDDKTFATYIKDPRAAMPGNKMAFAGVKDEKDVADLTAYLKQFDKDGKVVKK
jgi:cytochrome c